MSHSINLSDIEHYPTVPTRMRRLLNTCRQIGFSAMTLPLILTCVLSGSCSWLKPPKSVVPGRVTAEPKKRKYDGLDNVLLVADGLLSGSEPDGEAGFDSLSRMGVRTVISVDGARPDIERVKARNMRYVHIPIGYDGIRPNKQLQLVKAIHDLPGPIYVHCHHGKHRGPAAAAFVAVALGAVDHKEALAFMQAAGTSSSYQGLYACVEQASPQSSETLDQAPADFPEIARVSGIISTMAGIDRAFDNLKSIRGVGSRTPPDHPDLVPLAEARRVVDLLSDLQLDPEVAVKPQDFFRLLHAATLRAKNLAEAVAGNDRNRSAAEFKALAESCTECHVRYRD